MTPTAERTAGRLVLALLLLTPARSPLTAQTVTTAEAGLLRIRSQPGVEVFWEGVSLGRTDAAGALEIRAIPPGIYSVSLQKEGYGEVVTRVEIGPGESQLERLLEKIRTTEPLRDGMAAPSPTSAGPPPARAETAAAPSGPGPAVAAVPPTRPALPETEPATEPAPSPRRNAAAPPEGPRDPGLSSGVYLLGLTLLGAAGFLLVRRRRSRAHGLMFADTPPRLLEPRRLSAADSAPDFLGALRQREAALEDLFATRRGRSHLRVVEPLDLEPVEDEAEESVLPPEAE